MRRKDAGRGPGQEALQHSNAAAAMKAVWEHSRGRSRLRCCERERGSVGIAYPGSWSAECGAKGAGLAPGL